MLNERRDCMIGLRHRVAGVVIGSAYFGLGGQGRVTNNDTLLSSVCTI